MAKILATCFECGEVELHRSDICLRYCIDNQRTELQFFCSVCRQNNIKQFKDQTNTVEALLKMYVPLLCWGFPTELINRQPQSAGFTDEEIHLLAKSLVTT